MSNIKTISDVIFVKDINIGGTGSGAGGNLLSSASGSTLVGDSNTYSGFTPAAATVKGALSGISTSLNLKMTTNFSNASGILSAANGGTGASSLAAAIAALSPLSTKGDLWGFSTLNARVPVGTNGQVLTSDSTNALGVSWAAPVGTVSSVDASVPPFMSVTGGPITSSGTLAFSFISQAPNVFFASPDGTSGAPGFRAIVAADIPVLNQNTTGSAATLSGIVATANGGTGISGTAADAFNALSPMTTTGDMIYELSPGVSAALPIGTTGQILTVVGGLPAWMTSSAGTVSNFVFTNGGGFTGIVTSPTTTPTLSLTGTLSGDVTGPLTATVFSAITNSTLTTLSALSLPYGQITGAPAAITALTGDGTATGPGSVAFTLATVATGATTGSSTAIPVITFNNKGLVTAVTTASVIAPAGTLSGTTLNATVVTSSLTTVGTIGTGTWAGTAIAANHGGTGQTVYAVGDTLFASSTSALSKLTIGSTGQVLTVAGGVPTWATPTSGSVSNFVFTNGGGFTGTVTTPTTTPTLSLVGTLTGDITGSLTATVLSATSNTTLTSLANLVTVGTIGTGVWAGTAIAAIHGGTGQTTYAVGDTLYASSTTALSKLTIGSTNQVLTVIGGVPTWQTPASGGSVTNFVFTNGGGFTGTVTTSTTTPTLSLVGTLTGDITGSLTATVLSATTNATLTTLSGLTTASALASVGTITAGTWNATTIAIAHGGTGQTTAAAAFNALSPMTTTGDLEYESATNVASRLPIGTTGQVLTVVAGLPAWSTLSGSGTVTNFVFTNGGGFTGTVTSPTTTPTLSLVGTLTGDITGSLTATVLSATTNSTLTTLSGLTTASSLASVGTITTGTWNATTIAINHGGTGQTTAAAAFNALAPATALGGLIVGSGTNTYANLAIGTTGQVLTVVGGTAAWATATTGANTALSNLASVAINTGLVFGAAVAGQLSTANSGTFSQDLNINTGTAASIGSGAVVINTGNSTGSANSGVIQAITGTSVNGPSGAVTIASGNTSGTGNSGNVSLTVGSSSGGTQGTFKFLKTGVASVVGQVWTASATDGTGYWATGGSGANTALSNLASTAVNANIVPASNNAITLGTAGSIQFLAASALRYWSFFSPDVLLMGLLTSAGNGLSVTGMGIAQVGIANFALAQDPLWFVTTNDATANAIATADIQVVTGNKTAGTGNSGQVAISTGSSAGGNTGNIGLTAGNTGGSGTAGTININSGTNTGSGANGAINITSGGGSSTTVAGGAINLFTQGNIAGSISITTNNGNSATHGGDISLVCGGQSFSGSDGGNISIYAGQALLGASGTNGGSTNIQSGAVNASSGSGRSGVLTLQGRGNNSSTPGAWPGIVVDGNTTHPASVLIQAGEQNNSTANGPGGNIVVQGGWTGSTVAGSNGGNVYIAGGYVGNMTGALGNAGTVNILGGWQTSASSTGGGGAVNISGGGVAGGSTTGSGGAINISTAALTTTNVGNTGSINLTTGNTGSTGAGNSGDIVLTTGTSTGGTHGVFKFLKSGIAAVVGQVWVASATDGTGYWATDPALSTPTFTGDVNVSTGNLLISTLGKGLQIKTGTNSKLGTAVLAAGTVTVANTSVTANSQIFLTSQVNGGTPGFLRIGAKTAGTSFVITSSSGTDTSTVAWIIVEIIP